MFSTGCKWTESVILWRCQWMVERRISQFDSGVLVQKLWTVQTANLFLLGWALGHALETWKKPWVVRRLVWNDFCGQMDSETFHFCVQGLWQPWTPFVPHRCHKTACWDHGQSGPRAAHASSLNWLTSVQSHCQVAFLGMDCLECFVTCSQDVWLDGILGSVQSSRCT